MSDRNKAVVEYEVDHETILRAVNIDQAGYNQVWEMFEEIVEILEAIEKYNSQEEELAHHRDIENITNRDIWQLFEVDNDESFINILENRYELIEETEDQRYRLADSVGD